MAVNKRDIEFLFEVGSLRNVPRGWRQHLGMDCASVLEHTLRVIWLALILARKEKVKNEEKIIKMALIHDIAEIRTADHSYVQKVYVKEQGNLAAKDTFTKTSLANFHKDILKEYEERKSKEAKIVKDADNLDIDLELKELEERGSQLPKKWRRFRKQVRNEKLYTKSARGLWDKIQEANVADWHLTANKWLKIPNAGR
ncbi:HD domain-containing protein [Patescibacteria group bacterium]|nr:HD domain-containing protein [Patescibacteria group bacterium]